VYELTFVFVVDRLETSEIVLQRFEFFLLFKDQPAEFRECVVELYNFFVEGVIVVFVLEDAIAQNFSIRLHLPYVLLQLAGLPTDRVVVGLQVLEVIQKPKFVSFQGTKLLLESGPFGQEFLVISQEAVDVSLEPFYFNVALIELIAERVAVGG